MSFHVVKKISSIFGKKANAPKAHDTPTAAKDGRTVHVCQQLEASRNPHQANASTAANNKELEANLNELKQLKQTIAKTKNEIDLIKIEIKKYKNTSPMDEERKRAIDKLIEETKAIEAENEKSLKKIEANKKIIIKNSTRKIYLY